jgi:UPF0755 protein
LGLLVAVLFFALLAALGLGGGVYWNLHQSQGGSDRPVLFHVSSGDTVSSIAARLHSRGLITHPLLFRLDARIHGLGAKLKVGDYRLRPNMSIDETVTALTVYHAKTVSVTIPEGLRLEQVAGRLAAQGIDPRSFLREARHPNDLRLSILKDKPARATLEGYLFPNTYEVPPHYSGRDFAQYMVSTLDKKFTPSMRAQAQREHMTIFQVLTLASIVEREARVPGERPKIASVYLNRMKIGMRLQADPTVQYAVATRGDWWPMLRDLAVNIAPTSPYNTYTHTGLPPGPIASPGLSSIQAVLKPARTRFLFFVAKGHGRHAFARTYAQQLRNQQKYSRATP